MKASEGRGAGSANPVVAIAIGLAACSAAIPCAQAADGPDERAIVTESGPLKGIVTGPIAEYVGIPYAAPPVGALRWMPPQPFGRWRGIFRATRFGSEARS